MYRHLPHLLFGIPYLIVWGFKTSIIVLSWNSWLKNTEHFLNEISNFQIQAFYLTENGNYCYLHLGLQIYPIPLNQSRKLCSWTVSVFEKKKKKENNIFQ